MSITLFNIGLSLLSRHKDRSAADIKAEARRVLSLLDGKSITDDDILKEQGGRPFFVKKDKPVDFNISHSGNMVAVSHARSRRVSCETRLRTGCDIQLVKERTNTGLIAEQFFFPAEREYILTQKEQGNDCAFFEIWALKESYIKLHGLSVFDMAKIPCFCKNNKIYCTHPLSFYLYKLNDEAGDRYILAAAVNENSKEPLIHWFSEHQLPCKGIDKIKIKRQ